VYPDSAYQTMFAGLIADAAKTNREFKLIQLRCGTKDHLLDASDAFDKCVPQVHPPDGPGMIVQRTRYL
jgi:hypothetical protein